MNSHDVLILNGTVIDGSRSPRFDADVAITGGRITAVGDLSGHTARQSMDASGLIVSPGFIDSHTHDDQALLTQPDMTFKVSQGVTTVIGGNCGISAAPLTPDVKLPMPLAMMDAPGGTRFATFAAYLHALRQQPSAVNVAALVGHSTLRTVVLDQLDRPARPDEIERMRTLLQECLDAGAIGMSTGTFYPPAAHATTEEIIEVGRPLTSRQGLYVTHMRDESDHVMDSLEETFRIGRELGVPVVVSHHKVTGAANFGRSQHTLPFVREAMKRQPVCIDCYPYNASSTMIRTDHGRLEGPVLIASSIPHPECAGRYLSDIANDWGTDLKQAADRLQPGTAIYFLMEEQDVQRIMAFDGTMIGSDGIPIGDKPHPRLWGTFPRVLGHYSRDVGLFPLETAVWKMTGLTAKNFGLRDRGQIKVGHCADLVIFNPDTVRDTADYEHPTRAAEGIRSVLVNGVLTWHDGQHTGGRAGQVLTRQAD